MEDYPSNSRKAKADPKAAAPKPEPKADAEKKQVKQITVGKVTRRKKTLGKRIVETFGGSDAQSVGSYILSDVLLPAAKDMVADAVSQGIEKMLFGEARGRRGRTSSSSRPGSGPYRAYDSYSPNSRYAVNPGNRREEPRREMSRRSRSIHNFDEIVLDSRAEATEVLDNLQNLINQYEVATVADLYSMVGVTGDFTDEKWGWFNLEDSEIRHSRGGYLLDLPRPENVT